MLRIFILGLVYSVNADIPHILSDYFTYTQDLSQTFWFYCLGSILQAYTEKYQKVSSCFFE